MQTPPSPNSPSDGKASTRARDPRGDVEFAAVSIPDHTLLRPIGRGSYGEVWLARNIMGVFRAVKIVHRKTFADRRPFDRELSGIRKFEPISRSHDGFIDVLHAGLNEGEGYFYYVMEIGDDVKTGQQIDLANYSPRTLAKELEPAGRLPAQDCLRLGLALSNALAELHRHGLVHRDVKPSNIIFVNGTPKLADIGLVADINEARSYVGTEGFIPPEGPGTPQADIYALGKVLYEASTGKDRHCFPELPTNWDDSEAHQLLAELNEIVLQACHSESARRYRSAWDMHANLLLVVNGKSVKRLRILERRLAKIKSLAIVSGPVLVLAAGIAYHFYRERRMQSEARQKEVGESIAYGTRAVEGSDPAGALPYFAQALELDKGNPGREVLHRLRFGTTLTKCAKIEYMGFFSNDLVAVAFSPDGRHLAVVKPFGQARIIDVDGGTGRVLPPDYLYRATYSPDGTLLATAGFGNASIWDASNGELRISIPQKQAPDGEVPTVMSAAFSPDGLRVVTASTDGRAQVRNARTGDLEHTLEGHTAALMYAAFSHGGGLIVTASRDGSARLWDAKTGRRIGPILGHSTLWINYAAFSPDDNQLVTASADHQVRVFDIKSGQEIPPAMTHGDAVVSAEFSPDGRYILTGALDYTARLWLADGHQPVAANGILRHSGRVRQATFDQEGVRVATACEDGTIRIWNLAQIDAVPFTGRYSLDGSRFLVGSGTSVEVRDGVSKEILSPRMDFLPDVESIQLNRNGHFVVATSVVRTEGESLAYSLQVRNAQTGQAVGPDLVASNSFAGSTLSDDGTRLATTDGSFVQIWNTSSGTPLTPQLDHGEPIRAALFSGDGGRLLTCGEQTVILWGTSSGQRVFAPLKHEFSVKGAQFSPDGSMLLTCGLDSKFTHCPVQIWDSITGQLKFKVEHEDGVFSASFDATGGRFATASEDFSAAIWEVPGGRRLVPPLRHAEKVRTAVFSHDGKWLLTASTDKTARVWNAATGEPLTPPLRHCAALVSARFIAGDAQVLTIDERGNQRIWNLSILPRPSSELQSLANLLSGGRIVPPGGEIPSKEQVAITWQRLRSQYPSDFITSEDAIANWHRCEAEQSEVEGQWSAALFHLERLARLQPQNSSVADRLDSARNKLSRQD